MTRRLEPVVFADTFSYFSTMTGIVLTISFLAAFHGDAAAPVVSGAVYLAEVQRNAAAIEKFRVILPHFRAAKETKARMALAPVFLYSFPAQYPNRFAAVPAGECRRIVSGARGNAPIRGPDFVSFSA